MGPHKGFRGLFHSFQIQSLGIETDPVFQKRIPDIGIVDPIDVFFLDARSDGIEFLRRLHGIQHGDIHGKPGIDGQRDPLHGNGTVGTEIGAVPVGMHAGIGTAAADHVSLSAGGCHRLLHGLTHRDLVFLYLPPVITGAVVS